MLKKAMSGPLRFVVYLFVISGFVCGALYYLLQEERRPEVQIATPTGDTRVEWKWSERAVADANEEFQIEQSAEGNQPLASTSTPDPWPNFNGTNHDNRSSATDLLEEWPAEGPPLRWRIRGLGNGYSSVAIVDGVLYTMGNKGKSEVLIALDAGTGEKIWSTPFARASNLAMGPGPRCTPTIFQGSVYAIGAEGDLICADAKTGDVRWKQNILTEYNASIPTWGICESILIDDDHLICTPGGSKASIACLNRNTGAPVWTAQIAGESTSYASAIRADVGGVAQYVQFLSGGTVSVRANDGQFLWRNNQSSSGTANCSSPLLSGDTIFTAAGYGAGGTLLKLTSADGKTSAELVYHTKDMKNHHGDMVIDNGFLYGSNDPGILVCLELETGNVKWQNRSVGKGAVTFADGKIYLRSEKGDMALVAASPDDYRELGRFTQPDRSKDYAWSHPVVSNDSLFLRDQGLLLCYNLKRKP